MRSRFLALRVRPANIELRKAAHAGDGELDLAWLVCEWPAGKSEPTKYWLSNLPQDTPLGDLVSLAKLRWRIEQDYRELKDALGLDHFAPGADGSTTSPSSPSPTPFSPPNGSGARYAGRPPDLTV
jgi:SRSO17 transposase